MTKGFWFLLRKGVCIFLGKQKRGGVLPYNLPVH